MKARRPVIRTDWWTGRQAIVDVGAILRVPSVRRHLRAIAKVPGVDPDPKPRDD